MAGPVRTAIAVLGLMVMVLSGRISLDLDIGSLNIPITGQSLAVLLIGYYCRSWEILIIYFVYLAAGAAGLPVFADGAAGLHHLIGKSGGYLYSFPVAALLVCTYKAQSGVGLWLLSVFVLSTVVILAIGMVHLSQHIGLAAAWTYGVCPYLLGGFIKCLIALAFVFVAERFFAWY